VNKALSKKKDASDNSIFTVMSPQQFSSGPYYCSIELAHARGQPERGETVRETSFRYLVQSPLLYICARIETPFHNVIALAVTESWGLGRSRLAFRVHLLKH